MRIARREFVWIFAALMLAGGTAARAVAGEKVDDSLEYQLPRLKLLKPIEQQQPIVFVSMQSLADWQQLKKFWNPSQVTVNDPLTGAPTQVKGVKIKVPLGLSQGPSVPKVNPMTVDRWRLGRELFFDTALSSDNSISCATCHDPKMGFTDQLPASLGIGSQRGGVSAPTVMNSGFNLFQFWDGRAANLEDQAQGPVQNPIEMFGGKGHHWNDAVRRVRRKGDYNARFQAAFGTDATRDAIAMAIANFERTVLNGDSIHDRADLAMKVRVSDEGSTKFVLEPQDYEGVIKAAQKDRDNAALAALKLDVDSAAEKVKNAAAQIKQGRDLFFGKARCTLCHIGDNFTDSQFHNLGVGVVDGKIPAGSPGRYGALPTGHKDPATYGANRTPTLRGLLSTFPYMHDGSEDTLEHVIDFYDRGGNANEYLAPKMRDLQAEARYRDAKRTGAKYDGPPVTLVGEDQVPIVPFRLGLTPPEKASLVMFLRSLQGYVDPLVTSPKMMLP